MPVQKKLRVLVADDEPLARQRLEDLLAQQEDAEVVGTAGNGQDAVRWIRLLQPDVIFLDVQMPGLTGTEVVREIGPAHMPVTIFVTAYDQYALKAFELAALDYLVKPFEDERFEQAFGRAREAVRFRELDELRGRLSTLLAGTAAPPPSPTPPRYLERIAVDMRGQMRIVPVERIDFISADGSYAELHAGADTFVIREQMQMLEERLDPERFFRIHRGTIVQLDRIDTLLFGAGGDYALRLSDGRHLKVSRSRWEELALRLGVQSSGKAGDGFEKG